ncbi:hypothetical protein DSO57_1028926 [Entomophthora muscae]|uniref:Uncharacterized protein n=1 Tax=Entomophthora muscae TaxID=34485 RepID=A0ACC2UC36_9FUNG|nr:hypothetical protein DSO57_1028926 [Entomophthora muscae]
MVLTTGAASPSVTLFPCNFSVPSPFVSEVPEPPKVSGPPLEEALLTPPIHLLSRPIPESGWTPTGEAGWAWKAMYTIGAKQTR